MLRYRPTACFDTLTIIRSVRCGDGFVLAFVSPRPYHNAERLKMYLAHQETSVRNLYDLEGMSSYELRHYLVRNLYIRKFKESPAAPYSRGKSSRLALHAVARLLGEISIAPNIVELQPSSFADLGTIIEQRMIWYIISPQLALTTPSAKDVTESRLNFLPCCRKDSFDMRYNRSRTKAEARRNDLRE